MPDSARMVFTARGFVPRSGGQVDCPFQGFPANYSFSESHMRIAIVNDMPIAVEGMRQLLVSAGRHEIAWVANDGAEAVECCRSDRPHLVLMDLAMPKVDGVEATRQIMAETPCPILIVTDGGETKGTQLFDAMGAGAIDAVRAPAFPAGIKSDGAGGFLFKIDSVARLIGHPRDPSAPVKPSGPADCLVVIGASAGGTEALAAVLKKLPLDFAAAVVIVQHLDADFAASLAALAKASSLPVRAAVAGDVPMEGTILVASSKENLIFDSPVRLGYTPDPPECPSHPSIDAFLESAARRWRRPIIGVLLSGTGADGADGLKALRTLGQHTIAQDRGNPGARGKSKSAVELKTVADIVPLDEIATSLCARLKSRKNPSAVGRS